jgi:hypothetical protein
MDLEPATNFVRWLLMDCAYRQDQHGNRPGRGRRRTKQGRPILMYSRKVLNPESSPDIWGLCWYPGAKHIRGNDWVWRLTVAVLTLQQAGMKNYEACVTVASVIDSNCTADDIERLRVKVYKYIKTCERRKINLEVWIIQLTHWYEYYSTGQHQWFAQISRLPKISSNHIHPPSRSANLGGGGPIQYNIL